jgi:hypothetical protein
MYGLGVRQAGEGVLISGLERVRVLRLPRPEGLDDPAIADVLARGQVALIVWSV